MAERVSIPDEEAPSPGGGLADLFRHFGDWRWPVGSFPLGVGGRTLNDLLVPFTDVRSPTDRLLPETLSINDVGRSLAGLHPAALAGAQVRAQTTPADPDQPGSEFGRLMALFPMLGAEAGGAIAPATERGTTTLGTYAGRKAATADLSRLTQAKGLDAAGTSMDKIREFTGWFRDPAGDWKYEIPDTGYRLKDPKDFLTEPQFEDLVIWKRPVGVRLGDMAEHPALFGGYPGMADYGVTLDPKRGPSAASFSPNDKIIHMGIDTAMYAPYDRQLSFTPQHRLSALHEMTHGVQDIEGFARGGNPGMVARAKAQLEDEISRLRGERQTLHWEGKPRDAPEVQALTDRIEALEAKFSRYPADDYEGYKRLLGEVEARDVEMRADLDPAERQRSMPYASTGVKPENMIVRKPGDSDADLSFSTGSATPPGSGPLEEKLFTGPRAYFDAIDQWKAWGGKGYGRVENRGTDGWAAVREGSGPGALPPATGQHGLGGGAGFPGLQPVPPKSSVDRRGLPRGDDPRPGAAVVATDPEGRPLYADALIAGQRTPGGPETPLSMLEEIALAQTLAPDFATPRGGLGDAHGFVVAKQAGALDPPAPPLLKMRVDADLPDDIYMGSLRHEAGHALDYWSERTERGAGVMNQQYAVPDDVRGELAEASKEMRPDLWGPNASKIYERSEDVLDRYRQRPDELMADAYRYYKENPAAFKAKYPEAAKYIRAMVNDDPLLSEHIQFNVRTGAPIPRQGPNEPPPGTDPETQAIDAAVGAWLAQNTR
jgi:Large polyvalent protein associated domain 23